MKRVKELLERFTDDGALTEPKNGAIGDVRLLEWADSTIEMENKVARYRGRKPFPELTLMTT